MTPSPLPTASPGVEPSMSGVRNSSTIAVGPSGWLGEISFEDVARLVVFGVANGRSSDCVVLAVDDGLMVIAAGAAWGQA